MSNYVMHRQPIQNNEVNCIIDECVDTTNDNKPENGYLIYSNQTPPSTCATYMLLHICFLVLLFRQYIGLFY